MQLHERTIAELTTFVETLTEGQYQPVQRFVWEMVFGMMAGGSVLLSEISRQLEQDTALLYIEKRLSRQLGSARWEERELQEAYLEEVSPQVRPDTVLALDIGDLTKAYAQAMEGRCEVWDGSEGTVGTGYWLAQVEAHQPTGHRFPLWLQAWSQEMPEFVSENRVLKEVITRVAEATGGQGIWVMDRGGDREVLLKHWAQEHLRYIVRCCGNRLVEGEDERGGLEAAAPGGGHRVPEGSAAHPPSGPPGALAHGHLALWALWLYLARGALLAGRRAGLGARAPGAVDEYPGADAGRTDPAGLSAPLECRRCQPGA